MVAELRPRAVTRDIDWGIHIPLPEFAVRDDKLIYVWFDAVIGYLSASVEWGRDRGEPESWRGSSQPSLGAARERGQQRVPHHGGPEVLQQPRHRDRGP